MEKEFINERIDTENLPKFEEVELTPLHSSYQKVIWFNIGLIFGVIAIAAGSGFYFIDELQQYWLPVAIAYTVIVLLTITLSFISFRNRGFAFRTHDAIYRSGAIATTTTIIPYNRVQHVAVYEGFISRALGLAEIEIFTAGGNKSDIQIPGIEKEQAEKIKVLLMGKIIKQEPDEE
jgi:membrane protein YdbS with pleckstrin-like domain